MTKQFSISKSARLRSTPFTDLIEEQGVKSYTVYNHMLLPTVFEGIEDDCEHLKNFVQLWDVSVERQIEISGPDSSKLVQMMTCRNLSKAIEGTCYYAPIIDEKGFIINDPLIMLVDKNSWWISIADSDVLLYAKGLATGLNLEVIINEPNINPLAVQGPKSFELMEKIFGPTILDLKFFRFNKFVFDGHSFLISRSGWSKQGGFEIYVNDNEKGRKLYRELMNQGKNLNVRAGCPNLIERIEGGLLSYGNDMTIEDNILECGLDDFVSFSDEIEYLAKDHLINLASKGIKQSLTGIKIYSEYFSLNHHLPIFFDGEKIGELRSLVYSPKFKCCLGITMINKEFQSKKGIQDLVIDNSTYKVEISSLPFSQ
ncbi:MAG: dimethylsulfoniopropionate demethylase [Pelagibacteraceae bacterium]|nr:dimethylsulfoniopropionate demethylase [Pelagibacteraceae bacterium]|tara:strand:+ start:1294 stop:2406 length:1113 start_codon:yes stop_codon:yes gene_type:complete